MKIGIVSDSHGLVQEIKAIYQRHQHEVELWIHCGDSELFPDSLQPFVAVKGNCDLGPFPKEEKIETPLGVIFVTHGHHYQVKSTLMPLKYRSEEVGAKVVCFGHTHVAMTEKVDDVLFINPGSIKKPRIRVEKTYCILDWEEQKMSVRFFDLEGRELTDMFQQYPVHT
ncbi:metallophosphoesterase family protein [Massilibacterium senegalense]|uniref:metallophosphoesterase family protein n=1 Tax=Massilibacterium senegalense TaxID=1632858 RepID=UPI0007826CB7|nr:metallophosphoesterase [Massilibacterium senegalense]